MKTMKTLPCAGQFNLRGKKTMRAKCPCCIVINLKEEYLIKQTDKEIKQWQRRMHLQHPHNLLESL